MMNCYEVKAKCGHVGKSRYLIVAFPIKADNGRDAAQIVRKMGRVKHDHKDAIRSVRKITQEEYDDLVMKNNNDPYLQARNKQEQNETCTALDFYTLEEEKEKSIDKKERKERIKSLLKRRKIMHDSMKREMNYIF